MILPMTMAKATKVSLRFQLMNHKLDSNRIRP